MVLFNYTTKEMTAKVVYYGPGLCGKTTNLQFIYDNLPGHVKKGKMLSLATKTDRTLFFDFLPIELGRIRGMKTRIQLYTVPGQVFYNSTRKLVLKGADGVVFVADSQQKMMESNVESYKNLEENLKELGLRLEEVPLVMQFNKRDLPHLASVEEMNTLINRHNAPFYEAVATTGIGVEDTLKAVTKLVLNHLASKYQLGLPAEARATGGESAAGLTGESRPPLEGTPPRRGMAGVALAADPGEMEIERSVPPRPAPTPTAAPGPAAERFPDLEGLDAPEPGESGSEALKELTLPEMEQEGALLEMEAMAPPSGGEDLSDLLEEIPEEAEEEPLEILEEPSPQISRSAPRPPSPPPAPASPLSPLRAVPGSRGSPPGSQSGGSRPSARAEETISPLDPLGIGKARDGETPWSRTVQVGTVSPGKEHQITVPLEMSVGGRKIRLHLRMTLTLSN